jgi:N-acyl homoserine lactone hydrolase
MKRRSGNRLFCLLTTLVLIVLYAGWVAAADVKIYAFRCGTIASKTEMFLANTRVGTDITVPVMFFLVKHDDSWIAFDTGNNALAAKDPEAAIGKFLAGLFKPVMSPDEEFQVQIKKLGLTPKDIKAVIVSHHHFDHAGAIDDFKDTGVPVYFQKKELAFVKEAQQTKDYKTFTALDNPAQVKQLNIKEVEGVFDVFGDGTVVAFPAPGHTVGLQSLLVKYENGKTFVLTSDALYTMENLEGNILPGTVANPDSIMQTFDMFRAMRYLGATIVPEHDPVYFIDKPLAPKPLF